MISPAEYHLSIKKLPGIISIILLIVGIGAGLYLVQKTQIFKPKATLTGTRIEVVGDNVVSGKAISRNVKLALTYVAPSPSPSPTSEPTASPTASPSPSPNVSLGNVNIQGAVAIDGTDDTNKEENRFTKADCPGKNFIKSPSLKINNPTLGDANWDCTPGYYFGESNQAKVNLSGPQTFTITPPPGYRCEGVFNPSYINGSGVGFSGCSATIDIQSSTNTVFIWFKLVPASVQGISTTIYAQEANSFPTHFRVSNDRTTLTQAQEQPFTSNPTQIDWQLTEGNGQKTVYAQFKVNAFWGPIYETSISLEVPVTLPAPTPTPTPAATPTPTPTPAPIRVNIKGAVTIDKDNPVAETRLTAASCPDKAYISSPALKVQNTTLGEAKWDCTAEYYFGENSSSTVAVAGRQEFTITPPAGYRCDGGGTYINGSPQSLNSGCSAFIDVSQNTREVYVWFYLAANPLGQNCQNLTNKITNGLGTSCNQKSLAGKVYDKVADINDDKSINTADRAVFTNNRYDETWCTQKLAKTTDPCPPIYEKGDTNWDNTINLTDLTYFFSRFGSRSDFKGADLDSSGKVDDQDLDLLKAIPAVKAIIEAI